MSSVQAIVIILPKPHLLKAVPYTDCNCENYYPLFGFAVVG